MRRLTMLIFVTCGLAGCSSQGDPCVLDSDCFRGEACVDGFCGEPIPLIEADAGGDAGADASASNNAEADSGDNNMTPIDSGTDMTSEADMGGDAGDNNSTTGVCKVDPFTAMCPADDNDRFWEYVTMESGRGCLGGGDDFEGGMVQLVDQTLCPLESGDKFSTNLLPCDNITFVVEVTVTPKEPCEPDDWDLNVRLQGNDCVEGNGMMRCETLPDGSKRAIGFLAPSNSVTSPYIDVTPIAENLQFDYDLTILTRE